MTRVEFCPILGRVGVVALQALGVLLQIDFPTINFLSYLIWLSYLISDHSDVWPYVQYYKVQGYTWYTHLMHGQCMHHCTLQHSTVDMCI